MNRLQLANDVLQLTGLGGQIETTLDHDPDSDAGFVLRAIEKARLDVSRKTPNKSLQLTGAIVTVPLVRLSTRFAGDNELQVTQGSPVVTSPGGNPLLTDPAWLGRLFHVVGDRDVYRIRQVSPSQSFQIADLGGTSVNYLGTTKDGVAPNSFANGEIGQDRYMLPANFKSPVSAVTMFGPNVLKLVGSSEMDRWRYGVAGGAMWSTGAPTAYAIHQTTQESGVLRWWIELDRIPDVAYQLPFRYETTVQELMADEDMIGWPPEYEMAVSARARWYVFNFRLKNREQAAVEEMTWREIFGDQHRAAASQGEVVQFVNDDDHDHWAQAYG